MAVRRRFLIRVPIFCPPPEPPPRVLKSSLLPVSPVDRRFLSHGWPVLRGRWAGTRKFPLEWCGQQMEVPVKRSPESSETVPHPTPQGSSGHKSLGRGGALFPIRRFFSQKRKEGTEGRESGDPLTLAEGPRPPSRSTPPPDPCLFFSRQACLPYL